MVILLQPTSPLRTGQDVDRAVCQFRKLSATSLMSVHKMTELPYECVRLTKQKWKLLEKTDLEIKRRQDYQGQCYYINGAIYIVTPKFLKVEKSFKEGETELFIMDPEHGVDVDTVHEANFAEFLMHERTKSQLNINN